LKDSIDFVIWTGDSARHDSDEEVPRTEEQVIGLNQFLVDKIVEIFGKEDDDDDPTNDLIIPVIPNFGNNDILPHNIFTPGPNKWTRKYSRIWRKLIPEPQRHSFERGGWFFVEVIPEKLAVFSMNTLYFFDSNTAVDGCANPSEPGYEQMEWLRIQLQFLRQRGMKAILTGHIPPARTENKLSWDETCWHKYTLWMHQYRDVVVGSAYGHMNIDHFMLQDSKEVDQDVMDGKYNVKIRAAMDEELTIQSSAEYLSDLRTGWRKLPKSDAFHVYTDGEAKLGKAPEASPRKKKKAKKPKKSKEAKYLEKIGGKWGERYSLSLVGPSVVPNYYPTMRVIEYNISGLAGFTSRASRRSVDTFGMGDLDMLGIDSSRETSQTGYKASGDEVDKRKDKSERPEKVRKEKKKHKAKKPKFTAPLPPSKSAPPGPAYSPQTFTWLSITQYSANLTTINNDFTPSPSMSSALEASSPSSQSSNIPHEPNIDEQRWHEGKHSGKKPHRKKAHKTFAYQVEYDTRNDPLFNLTDLTVRSYIDLASRMGHLKLPKVSSFDAEPEHDICDDLSGNELAQGGTQSSMNDGIVDALKERGKGDKKKRKRRRQKENAELWLTFVRRAFVGSRDEEDLRKEFGSR